MSVYKNRGCMIETQISKLTFPIQFRIQECRVIWWILSSRVWTCRLLTTMGGLSYVFLQFQWKEEKKKKLPVIFEFHEFCLFKPISYLIYYVVLLLYIFLESCLRCFILHYAFNYLYTLQAHQALYRYNNPELNDYTFFAHISLNSFVCVACRDHSFCFILD